MTYVIQNAPEAPSKSRNFSEQDIDDTVTNLVDAVARTAIERDRAGGTAKKEKELIKRSGLLSLTVPVHLGGLGASWIKTLSIIQKIAEVDSSLAHVFAFHHLMLATLQCFGVPSQAAGYMRRTVQNDLFWGNALNPKDPRTVIRKRENDYLLSGEKSFCSGATDSDMLIASATDHDDGSLRILVVPTRRAGVIIHNDWNNMGQRQTDSGSVSFQDVPVFGSELLLTPGPLGSPFATLRPSLAQLILTNIYLGIAKGAFSEARRYLRDLPGDGNARISSDPYALRTLGELSLLIEAADATQARAVDLFQQGWDQGNAVTPRKRGEIAIAIAVAKVSSARAGLDVSSKIFEVMGARATATKFGFDRFWRNVRTYTLHDPLDDKLREIGLFALNGEIPNPSFYS